MLRPLLLLPAALVLVVAAACSSEDGRALPEPRPDQTTTTSTVPSTGEGQGSVGQGAVEVFSLFSDAFAGGATIPVDHTCDGADTSPPLAWASTPPAAELALVVRDPDADGVVHWVVTGIDPLVQGVAAGGIPEGAVVHDNGFGTTSWQGPCPPEGEVHTYELALYALPEPLALGQPAPPGSEIVTQVEQTASAVAVLTGTYGR